MSDAVALPVVWPRPVVASVWDRFAPSVGPARSARVRGLVAGPAAHARPDVSPHLRRAARPPPPRDVPGLDQRQGSVEIQIP